ncbi:hypothetical protein TNCV_2009261 [Trichonephila clavipes]|nr:hypothetical protein TNCV_2009261 [Trichonephila clavipes]
MEFSKFNPHTCNDCPCALLIVIAKASRTGNCKRLNSNDISVGIIGIRGSRTSSPLNFPVKIVASITLFIIFLTESLVPLQSRGGFMFRRSMMGTPIFNVGTCGGMPRQIKRIQEFSWIVVQPHLDSPQYR